MISADENFPRLLKNNSSNVFNMEAKETSEISELSVEKRKNKEINLNRNSSISQFLNNPNFLQNNQFQTKKNPPIVSPIPINHHFNNK